MRQGCVAAPGTRDTWSVGEETIPARQRTKNLEALGRFVTKEFEEGLSGKGGTRVGLMIEAPLGDCGPLIHPWKFRSTGTFGIKAGGV